MSLLPIVFSDYWDELNRAQQLLDRQRKSLLDPEDLFGFDRPRASDMLIIRPSRKYVRRYRPYDSVEDKSGGASIVKADRDKFHVTLDVQQFEPNEINVKVVGDSVVIEGKHEEKEDDHGWISRQFCRKYLVPTQCDIDQVQSSLSTDGILTITAPRKAPAVTDKQERVINVEMTGKPALQAEKSPTKSKPVKSDKEKQPAQPAEKSKKIAAA